MNDAADRRRGWREGRTQRGARGMRWQNRDSEREDGEDRSEKRERAVGRKVRNTGEARMDGDGAETTGTVIRCKDK